MSLDFAKLRKLTNNIVGDPELKEEVEALVEATKKSSKASKALEKSHKEFLIEMGELDEVSANLSAQIDEIIKDI